MKTLSIENKDILTEDLTNIQCKETENLSFSHFFTLSPSLEIVTPNFLHHFTIFRYNEESPPNLNISTKLLKNWQKLDSVLQAIGENNLENTGIYNPFLKNYKEDLLLRAKFFSDDTNSFHLTLNVPQTKKKSFLSRTIPVSKYNKKSNFSFEELKTIFHQNSFICSLKFHITSGYLLRDSKNFGFNLKLVEITVQ